MMFILILNSCLNVALSHLVLKQKYLVKIDRSKVKRLLEFGAPLLFDGLLVFLILHGDRLIFARYYGADMLGIYSAAFLLAWTPTAVIGRIAASLGLPYFSKFDDDVTGRDEKYSNAVLLSFVPAVCIATLFSVAGSEIVQTCFGSNYRTESLFIAWLGLGRALAVLRTIPIVLALAEGRSIVTVFANSARSLAVLAGIGFAESVTPTMIMAIAATGEIGALVTCVFLNKKYFSVSSRPILKPTLLTLVVFFCGLLVNKRLTAMEYSELTIVLIGILLTLFILLIVMVSNKVLVSFCVQMASKNRT
jgi:O-antigen/teichoic acid export membrane protein